jgi:GT2 family glycosyltransferase
MSAVTICLLTYGDFPQLVTRALASFAEHCPRADYQLVVGANAISPRVMTLLAEAEREGAIDDLLISDKNLSKCPMMRRMFGRVRSELVWWFDDDSWISGSCAWDAWMDAARRAPPDVVSWGQLACCDHPAAFAPATEDVVAFVRSARWYRGLTPPDWRPGGKGEFNFGGQGLGDGRWFFLLGGCWMIRANAIRALDWPDERLNRLGDDVFLGEAIRQHGWQIANIGTPGVALNTAPRRGPLR